MMEGIFFLIVRHFIHRFLKLWARFLSCIKRNMNWLLCTLGNVSNFNSSLSLPWHHFCSIIYIIEQAIHRSAIIIMFQAIGIKLPMEAYVLRVCFTKPITVICFSAVLNTSIIFKKPMLTLYYNNKYFLRCFQLLFKKYYFAYHNALVCPSPNARSAP